VAGLTGWQDILEEHGLNPAVHARRVFSQGSLTLGAGNGISIPVFLL
jgi:hypothetical protein